MVLLIRRQGKTLFYGHDSGQYPDATVEALRNTPLDIALFDCTSGSETTRNEGHMDMHGVLTSIQRLRAVGAVSESTQLIATHFSHNGKALHRELVALLQPHGIETAYDGMVVEA
jgi:phosphoribosyl 1,2-cyclic phosphate phosphodiesterase